MYESTDETQPKLYGGNTYRQDDLSWRSILFLPFNFYWRLLLAVAGVVYFNLIIYEDIFLMKTFTQTASPMQDRVLSAITVLYIIDIVLSILHKSWESVQKSKPFKPRTFLIILVDIVSILPLRMVISGVLITKQSRTIHWWKILSMNGCLRIYRIFIELINLQQSMGMNPILLALVQLNMLTICLVSVFCGIWYVMGFTHYENPASWLNDLILNTDIDTNHPWMMYQFSFHFVYSKLSHTAVSDVRNVGAYEVSLIGFILYVGFIIEICCMITPLLTSYLKIHRHSQKIQDHIKINLQCLKGAKIKETKDFYNLFWNNWFGLHKCPLLSKLPLCLQKDVLTDVYWDALSHSQILRHFSINVKRQLSLVMESKFLQPGDHIFHKHEIKTTYYYIASGVVQIMSHYDGVSPIMSISAGSSLGGLSLILPTQSPTDVTCASVCEVRILTYKNFYRVLLEYPNCQKILQEITDEHIGHCKQMFVLSTTYKSEDPIMKLYGVPQDDKLKWIKRRWRTMRKAEQEILKIKKITIKQLEEEELPIEMTHTSRNLDIIVLNDMKWEAEKCCSKSRWPYVLDPDCNFVKVWLVFIFVLISLDCAAVTYRAAFMVYTSDGQVAWDHIICFAYLFDIYFQIITGVRSVEMTVMEPTALLRHHLKSPIFLIDILGSIPTRECERMFYDETEIPPTTAMIRLFKLVRVIHFFRYRYSIITTNHLAIHISKYVYAFVALALIATCFTFLKACKHDLSKRLIVCEKYSWFVYRYEYNQIFSSLLTNNPADTLILKDSLFFAFRSTLLYLYRNIFKTGFKDLAPKTLSDITIANFFVFVAYNIHILLVAQLVAMWVLRRRRELACVELFNSLKSFIKQKNVHTGLLNMLDSYIHLQWNMNSALELNLDSSTKEEIITPVLNTETEDIILKCLNNIPFFKNLKNSSFRKVCKRFRLFTIPENFIFCRSSDQPISFNIILNGYCNITSMLREDVKKFPEGKLIGPGNYFPLMEVAQNIPCLQTTVSVTVCEVAAIDVIELRYILYSDDLFLRQLENSKYFAYDDLDVVISKKKYLKEKRKCRNFIPRLNNDKERKKINIFNLIIKYVSYIFHPPFIIHPDGNFMLIWETIKVIQVIFTILLVPIFHVTMCEVNSISFPIYIILEMISFTDIIVRIYLGNYNENGIVVNKTTYYLSHSFAIDFISSVPFHAFIHKEKSGVLFILCMTCKALQIYRISGYIFAIQIKYDIENFKMFLINFLIHWLLIFNVIATIVFSYSCKVDCETAKQIVNCHNDSWIATLDMYTRFGETNTGPQYLILVSYYMLLAIFLGNGQGGYVLNVFESNCAMVFGILCLIFRYIYLTKATGLLIGGSINFTQHRENMRVYWYYIRNVGGSKELASKIAKHFTFTHSKLSGIKMNEFVYSLHPSLQSDLSFAIYYKSMKCLHKFVGESTSLMKHLTNKVDELYFLNNSIVISINEVNDRIYFIREGYVNIVNDENERIQVISTGSMFGSFISPGKMRHKLKFITHYNTNILYISADIFFMILRDYGKKYEEKFLKETENVEYINYTGNTVADKTAEQLWMQTESRESITLNEVYPILYRNRSWYKWVMYLISMIIPYLTVFPLLLTVTANNIHYSFVIILYIFDLFMLLKIFLVCNSTFTDDSTGAYISDLRFIRITYITTLTEFPVDVLSSFPFEIIGYMIARKWFHILRINRMLKLILMIKYVLQHVDKIYLKPSLRWFEFIAFVTLLPYILIFTWEYTTCFEKGCGYISYFTMTPYKITYVKETFNMFLVCLTPVMNLFTFTPSYQILKPWSNRECLVMVIFSIVIFILLPLLIGSFAQITEMSNVHKNRYEYNINCMRLYLQLRDLSESLLESLWNYLLLIWESDKGELSPHYVEIAPPNMKCELLYDLFGAHLKFNTLFEECHHDFIVQLSGRLKRTIYFPGDFIVKKLDIDGRMYFIHSGEVEGVDFDDLNKEIVTCVYITGQCFSLSQGLHFRIRHEVTYKARSMVEMLTLAKVDWEDLAIAFPEERSRIFNRAMKMDLSDEFQFDLSLQFTD